MERDEFCSRKLLDLVTKPRVRFYGSQNHGGVCVIKIRGAARYPALHFVRNQGVLTEFPFAFVGITVSVGIVVWLTGEITNILYSNQSNTSESVPAADENNTPCRWTQHDAGNTGEDLPSERLA